MPVLFFGDFNRQASLHEPGGARLRRALTDSCGWEIRARRSLAPPFMVQMRGCKTVETFHEPGRLRVGDPRSGPRLCEAQRFMVPMRDCEVVEATHEPQKVAQASCLFGADRLE